MADDERSAIQRFTDWDERESEKLRRREKGWVIAGPAVFGLRTEMERLGCLWARGRSKTNAEDVWAQYEGRDATGNDLVALAPDHETWEVLRRLCADSGELHEKLRAEPGWARDREQEAARRQFAINGKYLRAWAHSAGFTSPACRAPEERCLRALEMSHLWSELQQVQDGLRFEHDYHGKGADPFWLRKKRSRDGEAAGTLDGRRWEEALKNLLFCAWTAELLIALQGAFMTAADPAAAEQLVRLSNNWSVVQLYYVAHHLTQALQVGAGQKARDNHRKVHDAFRVQWELTVRARSGGDRAPALGAVADVALPERPLCGWLACWRPTWDTGECALHVGRDIAPSQGDTVSHLAPFDALDTTYVLGECLRGTHEAAYGKPGAVGASSRRMSTIIDWLYRFRCRRNYEDNISFVRGPMHDGESTAVRDDLTYVAGATCLLYELRIMNLPHPLTGEPLERTVRNWIREWLDMSAQGLDGGTAVPLAARAHFHNGRS